MDNQIKINFGGRILDEEERVTLKKYDHSKDDLEPLTKASKKTKMENKRTGMFNLDVIENNLFRQEEEQKEEKKKKKFYN